MIEYKNVALRYTEKDVLRDVNLQIEDGEFMISVFSNKCCKNRISLLFTLKMISLKHTI